MSPRLAIWLMAIGTILALHGAACAADEWPRFGNVLYQVPPQWRTTEQQGVLVLHPGETAETSESAIVITGGADYAGDLAAWMRQVIEALERGNQVEKRTGPEPLQVDEPYQAMVMNTLLREPGGGISVRTYVAANPKGRAELIFLISASGEAHQRNVAIFDTVLKSIDFASAKAAASLAPQAGAGQRNCRIVQRQRTFFGNYANGMPYVNTYTVPEQVCD